MNRRTLVAFAGVAVLGAGFLQGQQTSTSNADPVSSNTGSQAPAGAPSSGTGAKPGPGATPGTDVTVGPDQVRPPSPPPASRSASPSSDSPANTQPAASQRVPNPNAPAAANTAPRIAGTRMSDPDANGPYVVGTLDVLEIRVWNDPKLSGIYTVRPDGIISLPLIGEFKADGMTVPQLTDAVRAKLTTVMNDPEVNIQVAKINSKRIYVFGGVMRPGEMPLYQNMTVLDALSNVGFRDFANTKKIRIMRGNQTFTFNYKDVSKGKHMEENIFLQSGDRIFVPE